MKQDSAGSRRRFAVLRMASLGGFVIAAARIASAQEATPASPSPAADEALQDVVVTASKRSESLLKTPQSVAVLTGKALEDIGAQGYRDYIDTIPSLDVQSTGAGLARYNIRGVAALSPVQNDIATVGYYYDEVPISESSVGADITPYDVQRIEVLRGPQGTLYGEGSIGGTIKIVTNKPDSGKDAASVQADVSGTEHGGVNHAVNAMANLVVIPGELAVRVVGTTLRDSGYLKDPVDGYSNTNWNHKDEVRGAIRWTPDDALTVDVSSFYEYRQNGDFDYDFSLIGATVPNAEGIATTIFHEPPRPSIASVRNVAPPYTDESPFHEKFTTQRWIENVTAQYDFGWATLLSSASYYKLRYGSNFDAPDDAHQYEVGAAGFGIPLTASAGAPIFSQSTTEYKSKEVRLTSPDNRGFRWLLGLFYRERSNGYVSTENVPALAAVIGRSRIFQSTQEVSFKQSSLFGETIYDILPDLHLTAGARVFREQVSGHGETTVFNSGYVPNAGLFALVSFPVRGGQDQRDAVFKTSLAYDITDDLHTYFLFSEGSRPGGLNQRLITPYLPQFFTSDSTRNYEVGLKGEFLERRLLGSVSLFQIDWANTQVYINIPSGGQNIYNIPDGARTRGVEMEGSFAVTPSLSVGGSYGYLDAATQGPVSVFNSTFAPTRTTLPGNLRLPEVPGNKFSLYAEYSLDVGPVVVTGRIDSAYVSPRLSSLGAAYGLKAYDRLGTELTVSRDRYSLTLYGTNLLDQRIEEYGADFGFYGVSIDRPRTIGARVAASF